jgi:AraC family transcriptional regulator, ethanolamine operon transcriptional activator
LYQKSVNTELLNIINSSIPGAGTPGLNGLVMSQILSTHQNFSSVSAFSDAICQLGWSTSFRQLDCGLGEASFSALLDPTTILLRVSCDRRTQQDVVPPQGYRTFGLPISPLDSSTIENRPLSNRDFIYIDEQQGFSSVGDPGFEAYTVAIANSRISELSENLHLPDPGERPELWGTEIQPASKHLDAIKGIIQKVFTLEQSTTQSSANLDEMISLLLPSAILQLGVRPKSEKRISIRNRELALRRALNFIESHPQEALTVEAVCVAAATSLSTLERAFRERFSVSPKRYILFQRLNQVHNALLHNRDGRRISDVASDWGFWHMGQFAADYKSFFGYLPSETVPARLNLTAKS